MMSRLPGEASPLSRAEQELIIAHIRRLMVEAEDFFASQQHFLKATYTELTGHVDQLKYRAQFFVRSPDGIGSVASSGNRQQLSVPMPLNALTAGAAATAAAAGSASNGFPFGGRGAAVSATPLRHTDPTGPITGSPYTSSPLAGLGGRGVGGFLGMGAQPTPSFSTNSYHISVGNDLGGGGTASAPLFGATSTPPHQHLQLTTESRSPSLSALLDENAAAIAARAGSGLAPGSGGEWGSLSLGNKTTGAGTSSPDNTQHMMGSPQFTNTLSLDDLLARFAGGGSGGAGTTGDDLSGAPTFSFDMLYEELVGSGAKSRSPEGATGTGTTTANIEDARRANGHSFFAASASANTGGHTPPGNASTGSAGAATATAGGDRFTFGSAVQLFSANSTATPTLDDAELAEANPSSDAALAAAAPTYALLNSTSEKDVIPIDSIRALCDQHLTKRIRVVYEDGRPSVRLVGADGTVSATAATEGVAGLEEDSAEALGIDPESSCQVLVEFKRKRVLQYDSASYVPPGSYVVVGGDRGEDLGLVIYAWCETKKKTSVATTKSSSDNTDRNGAASFEDSSKAGTCESTTGAVTGASSGTGVVGVGLSGSTLTRSIGVGNGTVLRVASEREVDKLLAVQPELERRAANVCAQRVLEHALPMVIVDAEYQFNKKKLTFYYEARQRMDFRDLVRDLYKTFRARIWMELVDS